MIAQALCFKILSCINDNDYENTVVKWESLHHERQLFVKANAKIVMNANMVLMVYTHAPLLSSF